MYSAEEIMELFATKAFIEYKGTLQKSDEARDLFLLELNKIHNETYDLSYVNLNGEFDMPLELEEEYLNNQIKDKYYI